MTGKISEKKSIARLTKNKIMIVFLTFVLVPLFFMSVEAKQPKFRLNINDTSLEKGVSASLALYVENAHGAELIEIKGLSNFKVLDQEKSSVTRISSMDILRTNRYNYVIIPVKEGEYTLQGIFEFKGREYKSNQLNLTVRKDSSLVEDKVKDLFIKNTLDYKQIYFGEKFVLGYDLYSRYDIDRCYFRGPLDLDGFISYEIPSDELKSNQVELNGNNYLKCEVKKLILTPIAAGTYILSGSSFQVNVNSSDFSKLFYLQTAPIELKVKELPLDNQPDNFTGLVGKLKVVSSYNKREINYGESLNLRVRLSGSCNLNNLSKIMPDDIPGVSIYELKKNKQEEIENGQYFASREFKIIIMPEKTGKIKVPTVKIPYFNPESEEYESAVIEGAEIQVNGEMKVFNQKDENNRTAEAKKIIRIEQVNYAPDNSDYLLIRLKKSYLWTALYVSASLIVLALILFLSCRYWKKTDDRLRELFVKVKKEDDEKELLKLLNEMIKYSFGISLKAVSREKLKKTIDDKELLKDLLQVMDYVENKKGLQDREGFNLKDKIKEIYQKIR